ncbi:Type I restriction enzyme R protein [Rubripirellula obstinata]|uniref:Type I restriction enzyme R protein n=1 Tax=Rubripirellula obstinata TaxID=406547 RepID=A0A5B1CFE8_9BACT|nr:DEAD/DEAH box helicase family protein [Rubripirellula obstinata]KAA1258922.1 Type I restriction enzyme R protein [Rubripirellula obstinata]
MNADSKEAAFQQDIIDQMVAGGWKLGDPAKYDRRLALYTDDCLQYVKSTQPKMWEKYTKLYPAGPEQAFIDKLASQLSKADPQASDKSLRTFGTLGVLRHELRDKSASFKMCQFKPEHGLNPDTLAMYEGNILRVVPELVYSPWTKAEAENPSPPAPLPEAGRGEPGSLKVAKAWRIDLVLFVNGIPVATMELKSEFKQAVDRAITQYRKTRLPKDPETNKPEPLLTFKRGALVHFAVSQYEAAMTTRLAGSETRFLPFNKGTKDGGAGNDTPGDVNEYATGYLWNEVLAPANLLQIIGRFIHLEIKTDEDWDGRKKKTETLIFPRYHQWDLVRKLIQSSRDEGPGHKYLAQHSAGSGKSNSIAWTAHQLSSLYNDAGDKVFHSVIVVTDRTVLDDQLQDTIYQFEHADGVVGRINRDEGQGSKSEKLAAALENSQPIVIVTIQTFPFVLKAIENSVSLKERCYAIIADEAHSSQSGRTAGQLKEVLSTEATHEDAETTAEDALAASVQARRSSANLSYYAFTATPKSKTLELFGRRPKPDEPVAKRNKPVAFHVYSMRQAIEEGYILDVLQNYTSYKVAYNLAQKIAKPDYEVDAKKAKVRLGQWVRLHDYNIAQKVMVIVEHYRTTVMGLLGGHAKAMVVTGSRKEAVRYKLEFDKYIKKKKYSQLAAMVAFSGEVTFNNDDPNAAALVGEKFTESGMNPGLKGRDMRKAFDTGEYHLMIVAKKFQTGFDQPKLCAMYVDKKLGGLECVQTLSRLNRTFKGKTDTYVLDFFNEPAEILEAFQEYYETATLLDVSDPNLIWDLFDKLRGSGVFQWSEVTQFSEVFFVKSKSNAAISNVCRPAVDRWQHRHQAARSEYEKHKKLFVHAKTLGDPTFIANAEGDMNEAKKELDALGMFKADLMSFTRYYEFMSQIVDYDSTDLEKLSLFARHLAPLLREEAPLDDPIDLTSVALSHYRLSKIKQQDLTLVKEGGEGLRVSADLGTGKAKSKQEELLSQIIARLNELFVTDQLTNKDLVNYLYTIRDKVNENQRVMHQLENNSPEQALLGDFAGAVDDAVMNSGEAHQNQMTQYLNNPELATKFQRLVFDLLLAKGA